MLTRTRHLPRTLTAALGLVALAGLTTACFAQAPQAMIQRQMNAQTEGVAALMQPDALRVMVCGSASPLGADPAREQACIAVIAGGKIFLVDVGAGSPKNLNLSGLPMGQLEAVLLTHFHSDHISALADVNMSSWVGGRTHALQVMGPTGVERVVNGFNEAYALDRKYRTAHHGEELLPSAIGAMAAKPVSPGVIYDQGGVRILAFAVNHEPISPAYGYRFDFAGRSVVISGDTIKSQSLIEAAKGADLLFHDVMAQGFIKTLQKARAETGNTRAAKILGDIQTYHAATEDVFASATEAAVKKLVLYHLIPAINNPAVIGQFQQGAPDGTVVASDGMVFELPKGSDEIEQKQLFERK